MRRITGSADTALCCTTCTCGRYAVKMKWIGLYATFVHIQAKLGQENLPKMLRWMRWHCPPDTGFEIRALALWGRARYLSVTEAPHTWMRKKLFVSFKPPRPAIEPRTLAWKAAVLTTTLGPPPPQTWDVSCIAGELGRLILTQRRRVLCSSVISVNCTLICAVKSFGQSCEKYKWYSFLCGMEKYSTCSRNKVSA